MISKTPEMERMELRDAVAKGLSQPRDIREIIQEAFDETGNQEAAAALLGVHPSTLSVWINRHLSGDVCSRVVFPGFTEPARELAVA